MDDRDFANRGAQADPPASLSALPWGGTGMKAYGF